MVRLREKIGYGLGDTASNLVFQLIVNFLGYYYTDVYGLSPAMVGTLFAAVRVMDAVTDPLMGAICDRTKTRWGKFRPWMLWLSVPFGGAAVIAFTVPDLEGGSKTLYAFATYAILMLLYTAVNIPYCALGGVISSDPKERVSIQSWRFALAMVGNVIVSATTMPLVAALGDGDQAKGFQLAIGLFAVAAVILFGLCFATTRERVHAADEARATTVLEDLKSLLRNDQWALLATINFVLLVGVIMRGTAVIYYVEYVLKMPELFTAYLTLGSIGAIVGSLVAGGMANGFRSPGLPLIAATQIGLLAVFWALGMIGLPLFLTATAAGVAGTAIAALIGRFLARIEAFGAIFVTQSLVHFALFFLGAENLYASVFLFILALFFNQVGVPMLWSMMADSVDYGQWKTGVRITGMNFSANLLALKLGVAAGGAATGWLLASYGYVANQEQTAEAMFGIALIFAVIPGVCGLIIAFVSRFYTLTDERTAQIQTEIGITGAASPRNA